MFLYISNEGCSLITHVCMSVICKINPYFRNKIEVLGGLVVSKFGI